METRAYYEPIIISKIKSIPEPLLPDFMNMINVFQNLSNHIPNSAFSNESIRNKILSMSGAWNDFDECDEFIEEIYERRKYYFSGRKYQ